MLEPTQIDANLAHISCREARFVSALEGAMRVKVEASRKLQCGDVLTLFGEDIHRGPCLGGLILFGFRPSPAKWPIMWPAMSPIGRTSSIPLATLASFSMPKTTQVVSAHRLPLP